MYIKYTIQYFDRTCTRVSTRPEITNRCIKTAERVSASRVADEDGLIVQQQVSNIPATGEVRVTSSGLQVGYQLSAKARNVRDANGTQSLYSHQTIFHWKWFRIDPVTAVETQVPSWVHGGWYPWIYEIKDADRGKGIQARVSFLDDHGNTETLRGPIHRIPAPPNNVATGSPVITGTAQVGETLSVDLSGISNTVYIALNATTDCSAQGAICTERGRKLFGRLQLAVAGPDSPPTGTPNTPPPPNTPATGLPTIIGAAQVGETLTAGATCIADPGYGDGLSNAGGLPLPTNGSPPTLRSTGQPTAATPLLPPTRRNG